MQHLDWASEALWRRLEPVLPGLSIEVVARIESTSTELLGRARQVGGRRSGDTQPVLLVAEHQTRGRGRLGRAWVAEPGASLTFSLAVPLAPVTWSGLSLAAGAAIADALDPAPGSPRIALKWPNDLWLLDAAPGPRRGRKLGGILVETVSVGAQRMAIVGVGINVQAPGLAEGLEHGAAGMLELDPQSTPPALLARIALPLATALKRFEAEALAPFEAAWARRDLLRGQSVFTQGATPVAGIAEGIDASGALCVRDAAGTLHRLVGGEVSVRLQPAAAAAGLPGPGSSPPAAAPDR
ncbi:MAG: biotin--[acetyl-CoA-carboxylase] ligase [Rubrivivax sp.]